MQSLIAHREGEVQGATGFEQVPTKFIPKTKRSKASGHTDQQAEQPEEFSEIDEADASSEFTDARGT